MSRATPWSDWLGRSEEREDRLTTAPVAALAATLDRAPPAPAEGEPLPPLADGEPLPPLADGERLPPLADGERLPPLWHWLYFLPTPRASELGPDGHARRGGFLPPVPLPRRMWAGSRFTFARPLVLGQTLRRRSVIEAIEHKVGRSGEMVFVTVRHEYRIAGDDDDALQEWHQIVYRGAPGAPASAAGSASDTTAGDLPEAAWQRSLVPDDVLLFRYSALTFNAHRIHYDRRYVTEVEGYPGLVVHGPLIATLLLDLLWRQRPGAALASFEFRARRPCFDGRALALCGAPHADDAGARLWALDDQGALAMDARAVFG